MRRPFSKFLPDGVHEINLDHPLAANLIFCSNQDGPNSIIDLVTGTRGVYQSSAVDKITELGRASKGNSNVSGTIRFDMPDRFRHFTETNFTIVVVGNHDSLNASSSYLVGMSGNPNWMTFGIQSSSRPGVEYDEGNTFGKKIISSVGGFQQYMNVLAMWTLKRTGSTLEVNMDAGADTGTATLDGTEPMTTSSFWFHGGPIGNTGIGTVHQVYIFDRSLSDAELKIIQDNPQILKRPKRRFFGFPVAVGGPTASLLLMQQSFRQ